MREKSAKVLLALIVTFLVYLIVFGLTGCSTPDEALPTCDFVEATFDGEKLRIKVDSQSESIKICREYKTRDNSWVQCANYPSEYFNCISMSADYGEIITFIDKKYECQVEVK